MHLGKEVACPVKSARNYYTGGRSSGSSCLMSSHGNSITKSVSDLVRHAKMNP